MLLSSYCPNWEQCPSSKSHEENRSKEAVPLHHAVRPIYGDEMVRYDGLWESFLTFDNFYDAYLDAVRRNKYKGEAMAASERIDLVIWDMMDRLEAGIWKPLPVHEFLVQTEVKRRVVHAPAFKDRVVHHALVNVIAPLFERKYIYDSYASRIGKGTHKAVCRVQEFIRSCRARFGSCYVLQGDIHKYYDSVSHEALMRVLSRTIKDDRILDLCWRIISAYAPGIPIGALTSQLFANVYLDIFDHLAKDRLQVKMYLRYMDDFIVIAPEKELLWQYLHSMGIFLKEELLLNLNPKTGIYPASHGVDFCGYRTFEQKILPRQRNIRAARKRFKDLSYRYRWGRTDFEDVRPRVGSFLGYMKHCNGYESTMSVLNGLILQRRNIDGRERTQGAVS